MSNNHPVLLKALPVLLTLFITNTFLSAQASLCGGSLGNNILTDGDFGSGSALIYPVDPQLAPGFSYTIQTPPFDGSYILTNDMAQWAAIWSTWLTIGDNSEDPEGYMMVVNASEAPGIFYEKVIDNVCENTVYEFSADAINLIMKGMGGFIYPDISFYINDELQYTTGPVPQDEEWHTYGFTFTSGSGQSSLKLTLRNNAPGGGGNDLAIDNLVFRACGPNANIELQAGGEFCESDLPVLTAQIDADTGFVQWQMSEDSLTWGDLPNGNTRIYQLQDVSPGKHYFRFLYANTMSNLVNSKCRIISDPVSFEVLPAFYTASAIVCEGLSYTFGDSAYNAAGFYQHAFAREGQCDSIVTLELILFPDPIIMTDYEITPTSCEGASDGSVRILSVTGVEAPYTLTLDDKVQLNTQDPIMVSAGIHTAVVSNEYGCFDEQELHVPDGPLLQVQTLSDTSLLYGKRWLLSTTSNLPLEKAKWTPALHMSCPTCLSPEVIVKEDVTYIVEVTSLGGCVARDSITLIMTSKPVRYVPNVFSPNNDEVNDVFQIILESVSFRSIDQIIVLDRWGGVVHQQTNVTPEDYLQVWDGYSAKGRAMSGVYMYNIDYTLIDGTQLSIRGDVTVLN